MPIYDGAILAGENNVVVVTLNYRLGPLGFGYLGAGTMPGNMGLMDQRMAFKWVKENIANFGGDPNRITIFGESPGAISAGLHLLSPLSRGTFDRAIMDSGPITESFTYLDADTSKDITTKLAEKLKCPTYSEADMFQCFKNADAQSIVDLQSTLGVRNAIPFAPVVDKVCSLLETSTTLMSSTIFKPTPLIYVEFGKEYSKINPTYLYGFNHRISSNPYPAWIGATHSYETELVFGLPLNASLGFTPEEETLSRRMMTYWTNFAKSGNPNSPVSVPVTWPAYDNTNMNYLKLDVGSKLATGQGRHQECTFVNNLLPLILGYTVQHTTKAPVFYCSSGGARGLSQSLLLLAVVCLSLVIRQVYLQS
ncbi:acetylcholinesterase-like [Haliotis cracherodii]|uniref:acetylcholinesterase-like n=1 Tax=Haliotis cracherodii TaxID=6455 RepID=UPI0039ED47F0